MPNSSVLPVFPCLPGFLLHSTTGISVVVFFNLDLQLCFSPWTYVLRLECHISSFLFFVFCVFPHIDCFMGVSGYRGATSTGSGLQWDHKHCREICPLLQHCLSSPWLPSQGAPLWQWIIFNCFSATSSPAAESHPRQESALTGFVSTVWELWFLCCWTLYFGKWLANSVAALWEKWANWFPPLWGFLGKAIFPVSQWRQVVGDEWGHKQLGERQVKN